MSLYVRLSLAALCPVFAAVILYIIDKKTAFGKLKYRTKQLIYGIVFGLLAVIATEFGVDIGGATLNVRDASVLTAGLIFGAPAAIIAGVIGAVERWFAVGWGAGAYTALACTISTFLAGIIAASLRKHMFDNKKPPFLAALWIGFFTEVLHMLMIFITNMNDIQTAFSFVTKCALPMILINSISVMLSVLAVKLISKEKIIDTERKMQITAIFQRRLLICVVIAFIITSAFTLILQINISHNDIDSLLFQALTDVNADITDVSDDNILALTHTVANEYSSTIDIAMLAQKYGIAEINVIDSDGVITQSTNPVFVGYDMSRGEQSGEFLVLLNDKTEYVQDYQPTSYDQEVYRKYAGVSLPMGGFIQIGYDADKFQGDISSEIVASTRNRHIGKTGYFIIVDENNNIVSNNKSTANTSVDLSNIEKITDFEEGVRFSANVNDESSYLMLSYAEGYYIIAVLPKTEATFSRDFSVYVTVFMQIVVFVGLFVFIYFLIKKLVIDNIRKINEDLGAITNGNLDVKVDVRENKEFASLSDDINSTVSTLKQYIAEAAERIDKELEFARNIQHSALPSIFPPYPSRTDFEIFAGMDAAKEVGGDFYDFYLTERNSLVFMIADVSGKGIPAAMFMMRAKTIIKNYAEAKINVEQVFTLANNSLCDGNDADMFVTAWIGKLDLKTGLLKFANAGHNPPLVKHNGKYEYLHSKAGFVLGAMEGIKYVSNEINLSQGDSIFLYTDGVTEATDKNNELYGEKRLINILNSYTQNAPQTICNAVHKDVDAFVGEAPQFDDITMLCLNYKGGLD